MMAYAQGYCVDGSSDTDPEIEERIEMHRAAVVGYASHTSTKHNLAALQAGG